MPSSTGIRISIRTMSGPQLAASLHGLLTVRRGCDDGEVALGLEKRGEAGAYSLLVVGDEGADHREPTRWWGA